MSSKSPQSVIYETLGNPVLKSVGETTMKAFSRGDLKPGDKVLVPGPKGPISATVHEESEGEGLYFESRRFFGPLEFDELAGWLALAVLPVTTRYRIENLDEKIDRYLGSPKGLALLKTAFSN